MQELFTAFLQTPTLDTFSAVRSHIVAHEKYDGYSRELDEMEEAYREKQFADVRKTFGEAMPNLLLSPGAHMLLSMAHHKEGDTQGADMEKFLCFCCLDGIQLTGDGTREKPYLVLRTSDEYDLLNSLGKSFAGQALVHDEEGGKSFDLMTCDDGSELWFDITDMMAAMARRLQS